VKIVYLIKKISKRSMEMNKIMMIVYQLIHCNIMQKKRKMFLLAIHSKIVMKKSSKKHHKKKLEFENVYSLNRINFKVIIISFTFLLNHF